MTDIELAEEYANKNVPVDTFGYRSLDDVHYDVKQAFLAGLKEAKPKWHDLRKNPNDLPNDDRVVSDQEGRNIKYVKHRNNWFYLDRTAEANVIAWCEIPTFDKE